MANNFTSQPPAGQKLPSNWQAMAPLRAQQADDAYRFAIENAWRQPMQGHAGLMQAARLEQQSPAPKRNDARPDTSRFDGIMLLVKDDDLEQIWKDNTGRIVTIKKRK